MDEPQFMHEKPDFGPDDTLGYEIDQKEAAVKDALERLLAYLRRLRRSGAETREWSVRTLDQMEEKLGSLDVLTDRKARQAVLTELSAWEGHIMQVIRHYMQEASDAVRRIKTLNPPLTSQQLRPFIQIADKDRDQTVRSLDSLTHAVQRLARFKRALSPSSRTAA